MKNVAGDKGCNSYLKDELRRAGIKTVPYPDNRGEVPATIKGQLGTWTFDRYWYYWVARGGPLPFSVADSLHVAHGKDARVAGHCGCPSPREWYHRPHHKGVDNYHIDTQEALDALAWAIGRHAEGLFVPMWRRLAVVFTLFVAMVALL